MCAFENSMAWYEFLFFHSLFPILNESSLRKRRPMIFYHLSGNQWIWKRLKSKISCPEPISTLATMSSIWWKWTSTAQYSKKHRKDRFMQSAHRKLRFMLKRLEANEWNHPFTFPHWMITLVSYPNLRRFSFNWDNMPFWCYNAKTTVQY